MRRLLASLPLLCPAMDSDKGAPVLHAAGRGQEYLSLPEVDPASPFCTLAPGPNGPGAANMSNGPTQLPLPVCLAAVTRGSHSSLSKLLSASYCIRLLHAWLGPVTHGCMHLLWCML